MARVVYSFRIFVLLISNTCFANTSLYDISDDYTESVTRLSQKYKNIPSSLTVIKSDLLESLQVKNIPEALRLVPGMSIGTASGNDYRISYHGGSGLVPRRLQVLVDGLPIYRTGYAKVDWKTIGVSIDDIEKIEVVRSPSSASYGANSFQAVVNIVTKKVSSSLVNELKIKSGDNGQEEIQYRFGASERNNSFRLTMSQISDEGYDENFRNEERRDDTNLKKINIKNEFILRNDVEVNSHVSVTRGILETEFADNNQLSYPDINIDDIFMMVDFVDENRRGRSKTKLGYTKSSWDQEWTTCYPTFLFLPEMRELSLINEEYTGTILSGGNPIPNNEQDAVAIDNALQAISNLNDEAFEQNCGIVNQDFTDEKTHFEYQNMTNINLNLRTVFGFGLDYTSFSSETYTNGKVTYYGANIFGNLEYVYNRYVVNFGLMAEKDKNTDGVVRCCMNALDSPNQMKYHTEVGRHPQAAAVQVK